MEIIGFCLMFYTPPHSDHPSPKAAGRHHHEVGLYLAPHSFLSHFRDLIARLIEIWPPLTCNHKLWTIETWRYLKRNLENIPLICYILRGILVQENFEKWSLDQYLSWGKCPGVELCTVTSLVHTKEGPSLTVLPEMGKYGFWEGSGGYDYE